MGQIFGALSLCACAAGVLGAETGRPEYVPSVISVVVDVGREWLVLVELGLLQRVVSRNRGAVTAGIDDWKANFHSRFTGGLFLVPIIAWW